MIERFADWLVYDIFCLDASTALGEAINFFFYDTINVIYQALISYRIPFLPRLFLFCFLLCNSFIFNYSNVFARKPIELV